MSELVETEVGKLPATWSVRRFDSLFTIQQGKQVSRRTRAGDNVRPFLRTKDVLWGRVDVSELDEMHFTAAEEKRLALEADDLLICEGGDIGRTAIWRGERRPCYYQNHLHRARAIDREEIEPEYVLYWLWYAFAVGNVYFGRGNETTIPNLSKSRLGELPVPLPPTLTEQKHLASVLGGVQRKLQLLTRESKLFEELFEALLDELMTGRLDGRALSAPAEAEDGS